MFITVYKIKFYTSSSFHMHAGVSGVFYVVPDYKIIPEVDHLGVGSQTEGSFGSSNLIVARDKAWFDGAMKAVSSVDGNHSENGASWRVTRKFVVDDQVVKELVENSLAAFEADKRLQENYDNFNKSIECYKVSISKWASSNGEYWKWYACLPDEPAIGKSFGSRGRLDSTGKFATFEEAKKDWIRVAAEKEIKDFELDVMGYA